jgi:hypothetical protein
MMPSPATQDRVWLCEGCADDLDWAGPTYGSVAVNAICARCGGLAMMLYDREVLDPKRVGYGPVPRSIYTLAQRTGIVWDVNCYYRELGVAPTATRREIKERYLAIEGHGSERITYIVKQLLNPEIRDRYDAIPPGHFLFDQYMLDAVVREIHRQMGESNEAGGEVTDADMVFLQEVTAQLREDLGQVVDSRGSEGQTEEPRAQQRRQTHPWCFYLWRTRRDDFRVGEWQRLLLTALAERKEVIEFAVGLAGDGMASPWSVAEDGLCSVVYFDDRELPSLAVAQAAATNITQTIQLQGEQRV